MTMQNSLQNSPKNALLLLAAISALVAGACTVFLDTEALITPCASTGDCDDELGEGFVCTSGACLPEGDAGASEPDPEPADAGEEIDAGDAVDAGLHLVVDREYAFLHAVEHTACSP